MKRDMELVRKIMLWCEGQPHASMSGEPEVEGFTSEQVGYHVYLLHNAGLLDGSDASTSENLSPYWLPNHITAAGHDFIDAVRDDTLWAKARDKVIKPAGGATIAILVEWLKAEAKARLGLPP